MKKNTITKYENAVEVRTNNRRLVIIKKPTGNYLDIYSINADDSVTPWVYTKLIRGKVKKTVINFSDDGLRDLYTVLTTYLKYFK